jgi:hypothetical protein
MWSILPARRHPRLKPAAHLPKPKNSDMDWIKKNYDRFTLAVFAAALLGVAVMMFLNTSGFAERFSAAQANPAHNNTIPAVDTAVIDSARQQLETPAIWKDRDPKEGNGGLLFTATRYLATPGGGLKKMEEDANWIHSRFHSPIPNKWVLDQGFNALDKAQARTDADGDGFWNEDEWAYKTDPHKKDDHPAYHVLLFLKQWIKVPFRLKFQAYDGDPKTPEKMTFQLNTLDLRQPSEFLSIGDGVRNTKFKIMKFEFKEKLNPGTGSMEDVSELSVHNTETGDDVVLVLDKVVDSPNQFGKFDYYLVGKGISDGITPLEFTVAKLKEFVLKPEISLRYKLLDVNEHEAVIQLPDGKTTVTIPLYPGKKPE